MGMEGRGDDVVMQLAKGGGGGARWGLSIGLDGAEAKLGGASFGHFQEHPYE